MDYKHVQFSPDMSEWTANFLTYETEFVLFLNGAWKFCLAHELRQLTQDTKRFLHAVTKKHWKTFSCNVMVNILLKA